MAQREQVHTHVYGELGLERRHRGGLEEPVHPEAGVEAQVIGDEHVVEARAPRALEQRAPPHVRAREHRRVGEHADRERGHSCDVSVSSPSRSRPVSSIVAGLTIMCWVATCTSRKIRWSGERW